MKGKSALMWLALAGVAGAVLFETSYEVQEMEEQLAALNRHILAEQEAIQILRAEWSLLNEPTRLERLADAHTPLKPLEARQFLALESIPMRPTPTVPDTVPPSLTPIPAPFVAGLPGGVTPASVRAAPPRPPASGSTGGNAPKPAEARVVPVRATAPAPAPTPARATPAPRPSAPGAIAARPAAAPAADDMGMLIARLGGTR